MHDWLLPEINAGATVVTASRRLARSLAAEYAAVQMAAGATAWATPAITTYAHWLREELEQADDEGGSRPKAYRLSENQSRVLWQACVAAELGPDHDNLGGIIGTATDAWSQVHAFCIPADAIEQHIENRDQGVFARAARRYAARLDEQNWMDDATIAAALEEAIERGAAQLPGRLVFAGFDRITPRLERLMALARKSGVSVVRPEAGAIKPIPAVGAEDRAAEWRAAGAWARQQLFDNPDARVAIIVTGLEREPEMVGRLVREGFTPGWQTTSQGEQSLVNVSLGTALDAHPLVGVALLLIRWLHAPLTSRQLGVILRCNFLGAQTSDARARMELRLREIAARDWTPARVMRVFGSRAEDHDTSDFVARVGRLDELAKSATGKVSPATWARRFDAALGVMGWPGTDSLTSPEQQLVNRWRDLLNELSHFEVVTGPVNGAEAGDLIRSLARDTVFQAEDTTSVVSVLGPLEAAGLEFDAIRVTGLNADSWPASRRATPLLSRTVAREYGLPYSTPEDSLAFAETVLGRITASAPVVCGSYALAEKDSELVPTLVSPVTVQEGDVIDPGWHAESYRDAGVFEPRGNDPAPPVTADERIRGGAGTLDAQLSEPFSAFARGRLAISSLDPFAEGLTPLMRGNLIHDALQSLYADCPSQAAIGAWSQAEREKRIAAACHHSIVRHRVAAGRTLETLLDFEEQRIAGLLNAVINLDLDRSPFRILSVEGKSSGRVGGLELSLRHDRIDAADDGSIIILDYKTGSPKKFLEKGEPRDYQLVVYAATVTERVSGLGLYNVDSRDVAINGVGITAGDTEGFDLRLEEWVREVEAGAALLREGDVRVNQLQGAEEARAYGLLSRFAELVRDA